IPTAPRRIYRWKVTRVNRNPSRRAQFLPLRSARSRLTLLRYQLSEQMNEMTAWFLFSSRYSLYCLVQFLTLSLRFYKGSDLPFQHLLRLSRGEKGKWIQDQPKQVKRPLVIIPASNNYALIEEHKSESNPPYDYGIRRDPHRRYDSSQTTRDRPGRPSARERLSFTKESEAATHRENHSKSYTSALRTEWRPVIARAKSSTPQRLSHSQATHTPSPRPQREGPSTQLVTPVANQRSEDRGNHSSERRSALERLSQPEVRIPLLQDGVANSASGRLQEVDIQYLEDNLNLQTSGGSCRPSGSKHKRPIGEVDQQGFTERSPIRSLSEDRIHVSLRLGPVNNPEPNLNGTGMMALRSADVPKLGKGKASLPSGSKKRIVRSPTQGVSVKKRRITKGQNSPRRKSSTTTVAVPLYPWMMWVLWTSRNQLCFEDKSFSETEVLAKAIKNAREWQDAKAGIKSPYDSPKDCRRTEVHTQPPLLPQVDENVFSCYSDAAWNSSSCAGGLGWICYKPDGSTLGEPITNGITKSEASRA
ncbi:hypothetical protein HID58_051794, partial [Brassica napus]